MWYLSFTLWLTSLSIISQCSSMLLQMSAFPYFSWLSCIPLHIHTHHIFFIHSFIERHLGGFHILATVNNAVVNMGVHISLWYPVFIFTEYVSRSKIAGSYGSSIFNFLRNLRTVFHGGCTNLHSHQQCTKVCFSAHPHQHVLSLVIWMRAILTGVRQYLVVVLICISLMISDAEHFSMYLSMVIFMSFWRGNCLFHSSAIS